MGSTTAAGSALAISAASPTTRDATGYAALTFTEIGGLDKIGTIGSTFAKVEFTPLKGAKDKHKGSVDYGSLQPSFAIDPLDAGQTLVRTAGDDATSKLYSCMATLASGDKRYFGARVFGNPEAIEGADSILMATPTIEICTPIVKVAAS